MYVNDERGGRHHRAHGHIQMRGRRVASVYLETLEIFDVVEPVPGDVLDRLRDEQETLLTMWEELNDVDD